MLTIAVKIHAVAGYPQKQFSTNQDLDMAFEIRKLNLVP